MPRIIHLGGAQLKITKKMNGKGQEHHLFNNLSKEWLFCDKRKF